MEPSEDDEVNAVQNDLFGGISYYHNISGIVRGNWEKMDVKLTPINMTTPEPEEKDPNTNSTELYDIRPPRHIYRNEMEVLDANPIYTGNMSESAGHIRMEMNEYPNAKFPNNNVSVLESTIELMDESEDTTHTVKLRGLHIKST